MDNTRKISGFKYFLNIKPSFFNMVEVVRLHTFLTILLKELEPEQLKLEQDTEKKI